MLSCAASTSLLADKVEPYFSLNSFSHSEPTAIKSLEDWDERFYSGDVALLYGHLELGVAWKQWRFGLIHKYDYYYKFSASTAEFLRDIKNRDSLVPSDQYDLYMSVNALETDGIKVSYQHALGDFRLGMGLSYLEGRHLTHGNLSGSAQVITDKDYDLLFDVDYYYSKDKLFNRETSLPDSWGYGIDFMAVWELNELWTVELNVIDLFSEIKWNNSPRTVAAANSSNKTFDSDGYVVFKPIASGIEINQDFTQKIPTKIFLNMRYDFQRRHSLLLEYEDYSLKEFIALGYAYPLINNSGIDFLYNLTTRSVKLAYRNKWMSFMLLTDDLSLTQARTFGLQFNVSYQY